MAIKFLTPNNGLFRTTGLISGATNYTGICWFRPDADLTGANYQTVIAYEGAVGFEGIYNDNTDSYKYKLELNNNAGSGFQGSVGVNLTAGHWYPVCYQRNGTFHQIFISGIGVSALTPFNMAAAAFIEADLGWDGAGLNQGTFAYFREWNAVLNSTQLLLEFNSRVPVRTANLVTNTPLVNNLLDTTVNTNNWTATGVLNTDYQFVADDPIQAGSVVSEAIDMGSLPYSTSMSVKPTNVEFLFDKWFKYTSAAPEVYIGGWFFGDLTHYKVNWAVYSDAGITGYPASIPLAAQNIRFQMPVINGHTYYFYAAAQFIDLTNSTLIIDFLTAPRKLIPAGSYFINDDQDPFYSAIISSVPGDDYNILGFLPFVNTLSDWGGDVSNDNHNILVGDQLSSTLKLYSPKLAQLIDTGITIDSHNHVRRVPSGKTFYVGSFGAVHRIDKNGVVGPVINLPGAVFSALAANEAETILYVCILNAANQPVKKWDLVGSAFLADLAPGIALYSITDMMVISDNTIIVTYVKGSTDIKIIRYSTLGAILNTYNLGVGSFVSMSYDYSDPDNYFIMRAQDVNVFGDYFIRRIKISDGTFTQSEHVRYEDGLYDRATTATPVAKFGISESCPFFTLYESPIPVSQASGIYKITDGKRNDTLWIDASIGTTEVIKIPDPLFRTAILGD